MFVSNLAPITIIAAAGGLGQAEIAILLQNAMLVAGIATLIQLYPIWKVGSGLPIVMGVSFTFVAVLSTVAVDYGYPTVIGGILSVCIIFLVSAAETIGDTTAMVASGLNREITDKEISGSIVCDG